MEPENELLKIIGLGEFSAKKNYYSELEEKKTEYGRIFSEALNGILQVDLKGEIIICNPAFWMMCGYVNYKDIIISCKNVKYDLFSNKNEFDKLLTRLKTDERIINYDTIFLRANKEQFYVSLSAHIQSNDGVQFIEFFIQDINKRIKAENDFKNANTFTSNILNASTLVSIITTDLDGIITTFNRGAELMLGYSANELIGKYTPSILHLDKEVLDYGRELSAKYKEDIYGYQTFIYIANIFGSEEREWSYIKKSGERIVVNLSVTAIKDQNNKIIGHLGIAKDISKEKSANNLIVSMIDAMPSSIISVNHRMEVTHWNKEVQKVTGISKELAIGKNFFKLYRSLSIFEEEIVYSINTEVPFTKSRIKFIEHGESHYKDLTVSPLILEGFKGAVIRIDSVTEKVKLDDLVVQSEKMLSVGGLAAGMAHEINNPLAGIIQNAQIISNRLFLRNKMNLKCAEEIDLDFDLLQTYLETRGIEKMLESVSISGIRASQIIKNMLSFSRNSSNEFTPVNIPSLINDTITLAETDFNINSRKDFKSIRIIKKYEKKIPQIYCDPSKIQQVLFNLLKNGTEAMYGVINPLFVISIYIQDNWLVIEIEDNGHGMAEDIRKRIFEPFFTTKPVGSGTGLGMSVSYFIISDLHHGELSVESQVNKWTKFIIKLPISK